MGGDAGLRVRLRSRALGGHHAHALRHRAALQDRRRRRVQQHPCHNDVVPRCHWHGAQVHAKGCGGLPCETSEKNELRNLWQHVWRRHSMNNQTNAASNHISENGANGSKTEENSDDESDDQAQLVPILRALMYSCMGQTRDTWAPIPASTADPVPAPASFTVAHARNHAEPNREGSNNPEFDPCQILLLDLSLERRKGADNTASSMSISSRDSKSILLHEIIFSSLDRPKLLSRLTALLSEVGLNIREAHVYSTTDGYCLDVFVVDGWETEKTDDLITKIKETLTRKNFRWQCSHSFAIL